MRSRLLASFLLRSLIKLFGTYARLAERAVLAFGILLLLHSDSLSEPLLLVGAAVVGPVPLVFIALFSIGAGGAGGGGGGGGIGAVTALGGGGGGGGGATCCCCCCCC